MLTDEERIIFNACIPFLPSNPLIFDVGAYKGGYSDYVLSMLPRAYCYLFEGNKALFDNLKYPRSYNVLLSDHAGKESFYRCLNQADELSSTFQRSVFSQVDFVEEQVPCTTVDFFCTEHGIEYIDFLKVDVEGAELKVLQGSVELLRQQRIRFIQVEYGGTYPDAGITFIDVLRFVNQFGYNAYELVGKKLIKLTVETFVEDLRFANFLITAHDIE
jgi:FkbM family methyltransferase